MEIKAGVLALQGDVSEHLDAFDRTLDSIKDIDGYEVFALKRPEDVESCQAIAIPGGESTTISRLIDRNNLREPLKTFSGGIFATCAGMVLSASRIVDDDDVKPLSIMDIEVKRNAFGRQKDSFESEIQIEGLSEPFRAVFIRAPVAVSAGPGVKVIGKIDDGIVAAMQGKNMALAFHPELGDDLRLHELFIRNLAGHLRV
ncbi:SNO glutamine amidotransferase [Methanolacinia petrolearia DSM 11571]|uniref:Pyridoxal 5'-phosphate synthase subunit PdxT n=1 Tax=Methanolacinia petrolearia (strain DSM 11571 / OCM 486 / SEBR 4847) TaxID=679926 RepID=E1RJY3_METP4|nr:pyridoxal 5'-phosphate synthase glutaminase subunit PdxT [Methanolacinia petrolearia]ADN36867.1 SNO glutamine amidotransferase [Methanolacinia petrolearia DSM 11571]